MDATSLRISEIITARICHDLAGSLGVAAQGLDLYLEGEAQAALMAQEALAQTIARLRASRCLFGPPSSELRELAYNPESLAKLLTPLAKTKNVTLRFPGERLPGERLPDGKGDDSARIADENRVGRLILGGSWAAMDLVGRTGAVELRCERTNPRTFLAAHLHWHMHGPILPGAKSFLATLTRTHATEEISLETILPTSLALWADDCGLRWHVHTENQTLDLRLIQTEKNRGRKNGGAGK